MLGFFSSRPNLPPPTPSTAVEYVPPLVLGGDTLVRWEEVVVLNLNNVTDTVVLYSRYTYIYLVKILTGLFLNFAGPQSEAWQNREIGKVYFQIKFV